MSQHLFVGAIGDVIDVDVLCGDVGFEVELEPAAPFSLVAAYVVCSLPPALGSGADYRVFGAAAADPLTLAEFQQSKGEN